MKMHSHLPIVSTLASLTGFNATLLAADSPEVHADSTVTFRLAMPKAEKVMVVGDWLKQREQLPMTKGEDGVWTAKAGPFPPGAFIYEFDVDGLKIPDPENEQPKLRANRVGSFATIPGASPWEIRNVPHGVVNINYHRSTVLDAERSVYIYTPPGYDQNTTKNYPVLYLLHGNNDTAAGWVMIGAASFITPLRKPTACSTTNVSGDTWQKSRRCCSKNNRRPNETVQRVLLMKWFPAGLQAILLVFLVQHVFGTDVIGGRCWQNENREWGKSAMGDSGNLRGYPRSPLRRQLGI